MGHFLWIFRGGLNLFDPKIALCYAQDNSGVKYCLYCFICFVCFALLVSVCLLLHVYGVCRLCCTANPPPPPARTRERRSLHTLFIIRLYR
jgi:hypothetical protein